MGRQPASGELAFTIRHGTLPACRGMLFVMQGVAGTGTRPTNPLAVSLR